MDGELARELLTAGQLHMEAAQDMYRRDRQVGLTDFEYAGMLIVHALDAKDEFPQSEYWEMLNIAMGVRGVLEMEPQMQDPDWFHGQLQSLITKLVVLRYGQRWGIWHDPDKVELVQAPPDPACDE